MTEVIIERARTEDAASILTLKRDAWLDRYVNDDQGVTAEDIYKKFTDDDLKSDIENWQVALASETDGSN